MAQFNINFEVLKHNILKLGKIFDLDSIKTDEYELVILTNSDGLVKDQLDTVDSNILSKEASNYTRPLIEMILEETDDGYEIKTGVIDVEVQNTVTIKGLLMVKKSSQDILACCLNMDTINISDSFSISPQDNLWVLGE